jgi:Inverse autotransporter, beta-domain
MLIVTSPPSTVAYQAPSTVPQSPTLPQLTSNTSHQASAAETPAVVASYLARAANAENPRQSVSEQLTVQLAQHTEKALERYLNRWGQVQVKLGVNPHHWSFDTSQVTALFPLWRQQTLAEQRVLFTQLGLHHQRHQNTTLNLGVGQRHLISEAWMLGYNLFYDVLLPHHHQRLGLGAEARRDYLSLALNGYYPISHWKSGNESEQYCARPARGADVTVEAYLPQHPHLGIKVNAERYFDDQVGAFTPHAKQRIASVTLGLHYTPVPLVKVSYDCTLGQRAAHRCRQQVALSIDYQLGIPLAQQLERQQVIQRRSLLGSLLEPVQRNHQILLAYREKTAEALQLQLPQEEELGNIHDVLTIPLTVQGDLSTYTLSFAGSLAAAAQASTDHKTLTVRLPHAVGQHTLQVIATEQQGKQVSSNPLRIQVVDVPPNVLKAAKDIRQLGSWNNNVSDLAPFLVVKTPIWPANLTLRIDDGITQPTFNDGSGHQETAIRLRSQHYQIVRDGLWNDAPAYSGGGNCFYDAILEVLHQNGTPANVTVSELRHMMAQVLLNNPDIWVVL